MDDCQDDMVLNRLQSVDKRVSRSSHKARRTSKRLSADIGESKAIVANYDTQLNKISSLADMKLEANPTNRNDEAFRGHHEYKTASM